MTSIFLDATFSVHKSSTVLGLIRSEENFCAKYLASLRKRIAPFVEFEVADGTWSVQSLDDTPVHSIAFPSSKFIVLVFVTGQDRKLVVFAKAPRQVQAAFMKWLEMYFDVIVKPVELTTQFILEFVDDFAANCFRQDDSTAARFEFGTDLPQLRRITVSFAAEDIKLVAGTEGRIVPGVFKQLLASTGIRFDQLQVLRVGCGAGMISSDGRVKFSGRAQSLEWMNAFIEKWIMEICAV